MLPDKAGESQKWTVRWRINHSLATPREFETEAEAQAWIDGYDAGAQENM